MSGENLAAGAIIGVDGRRFAAELPPADQRSVIAPPGELPELVNRTKGGLSA
jgi:hypothetical protein